MGSATNIQMTRKRQTPPADQQHGAERLAAAADCPGQHLDEHKGDVERHHILHHHQADLDDRFVLGEDTDEPKVRRCTW